MKKVLKFFCVLLLAFFITGCGSNELQNDDPINEGQEYTKKEFSLKGLNITMSDDMKEATMAGYDAFLESEDYALALVKEDFEDFKSIDVEIDENSSVKEYMEFVLNANELDGKIIEKNNLTYVQYTKNINSNDFFYMVFAYKSDDAFWIVNLMCFEEDRFEAEPIFIEWAKSVNFD